MKIFSHPYKLFLCQELSPSDYVGRMNFIYDWMAFIEHDPTIISRILWIDESRFYSNGNVIRHNSHYWSPTNPKWIILRPVSQLKIKELYSKLISAFRCYAN